MSTSPGTTDGLPTRKYVDCSTAHIERRVVELLEADAAFAPKVELYRRG